MNFGDNKYMTSDESIDMVNISPSRQVLQAAADQKFKILTKHPIKERTAVSLQHSIVIDQINLSKKRKSLINKPKTPISKRPATKTKPRAAKKRTLNL